MAPYYLPLDKAVLLFFASQNEKTIQIGPFQSDTCVVQVIVKQFRESTVNEIAAYFLAQHDITTAIENVIVAHLISPLPSEIKIEGKGYTLHGHRREWIYGRGLKTSWGGLHVHACEDKWVFAFEVVSMPAGD